MALYTIEQQVLLKYVEKKVAELFVQNPAPAHEFDHAERVAAHIREIAMGESARNPFLCELAAVVHDIGRTREKNNGEYRSHHELSYIMLQEWFREDNAFDALPVEEKKELLYAVRYHWNNAADAYDTAWILRDADKLDSLGQIGIDRCRVYCGTDESRFQMDIRLRYDHYYWLRTETAKQIVKEKKLIEIVDEFYTKLLKEKIEEVEL